MVSLIRLLPVLLPQFVVSPFLFIDSLLSSQRRMVVLGHPGPGVRPRVVSGVVLVVAAAAVPATGGRVPTSLLLLLLRVVPSTAASVTARGPSDQPPFVGGRLLGRFLFPHSDEESCEPRCGS